LQPETQQRLLKAGWHVGLGTLALIESRTARTNFRRLVLGACAGWHFMAALVDWEDPPDELTGEEGKKK
jgi:hypothetical protein